jgi:hypothetical protein
MTANRASSCYAAARRLDFIDWRLLVSGSIRRDDICEQFGISIPRASVDINEFIRLYPGAIRYDHQQHQYVPAKTPYRSHRGMSDPRVLKAIDLLAEAGSALGWTW